MADAVDIRSIAFDFALKNNTKSMVADSLVKEAKIIEKFLWGGLAPIEKPPTPLSTIEESAVDTRKKLEELIDNCADEEKRNKLQNARSSWERFISDLNQAFA